MNSIEKLAKLFSEFPGIGPRQARRFVYFLMNKPASSRKYLIDAIAELSSAVSTCSKCKRFFLQGKAETDICSICTDKNRDSSTLMVVSRDVDLESVEKTDVFNGLYFVLGGTVPILEKEPEKKVRIKELEKRISGDDELREVVLAMNANPDGDNTSRYLANALSPLVEKKGLKVSTLGRGLSTGTELEYSDPDTLANALKNRH